MYALFQLRTLFGTPPEGNLTGVGTSAVKRPHRSPSFLRVPFSSLLLLCGCLLLRLSEHVSFHLANVLACSSLGVSRTASCMHYESCIVCLSHHLLHVLLRRCVIFQGATYSIVMARVSETPEDQPFHWKTYAVVLPWVRDRYCCACPGLMVGLRDGDTPYVLGQRASG